MTRHTTPPMILALESDRFTHAAPIDGPTRRGARRARCLGPVVALALTTAAGCGPPDAVEVEPEVSAAVMQAEVPAGLEGGERAYEANCMVCHGERALGTAQGPPLVHIVYEPAHHADGAFVLAVQRGVRAHHWRFGDMPPVPGLSEAEVAEIIAYVRFLQRQAGIG